MHRIVTLLAFTRTHTASMTIPVLIIAALISGYPYLYVGLFAIFAYLFHGSGFVLNNLADYRWDRKDPNKTHFPLVTGEINFRRALAADIVMISLTYLFGSWVVYPDPWQMAIMSISFTTGILYNLLNKVSRYGPALISISFSFLIPYVMFGHGQWDLMILYTVFAFVTLYYQIGVSGYIKDIEVDQYNFMHRMGMHLLAGKIIFSRGNRLYAFALRVAVLLTGAVILYVVPSSYVADAGFIILQVAVFVLSGRMVRSNSWVRSRFLRQMSGIEILNYFSVVMLFLSIYGYLWALFLVAFPILWFMGFNRLFWGTTTAPNV